MTRLKQMFAILAGGAAVAALVWALMPQPLLVDLVAVTRGPMEVTFAAEGVTHVRETFVVNAPITGTVARAPVRVGDQVAMGKTVVARILPAAPALLDARAMAQAQAAVTEAKAVVRLAEVTQTQAAADADLANAQLERNRALAERGIIAARMLEDSEQKAQAARAASDAAKFDLEMHRATLARVEAQLAQPQSFDPNDAASECCVTLTAPHSGTVLDVVDTSSRLVQAGSPLLTIANLTDLEVQADLLSADAVQVNPGAVAYIEGWGGAETLMAHVDRIEPRGFTRISALGIEEQRVRLYLAFDQPPPSLGDGFRVYVRIVVWSQPDVLQVPQSALFRHDGGWAVFRAEQNRAMLTPVEIGRNHEDTAQLISGLGQGDVLLAYPGNRITQGAAIADRALTLKP